jgi:hypothetical protein
MLAMMTVIRRRAPERHPEPAALASWSRIAGGSRTGSTEWTATGRRCRAWCPRSSCSRRSTSPGSASSPAKPTRR